MGQAGDDSRIDDRKESERPGPPGIKNTSAEKPKF